jgi:tetratricopeptide (TPR) repeat protein
VPDKLLSVAAILSISVLFSPFSGAAAQNGDRTAFEVEQKLKAGRNPTQADFDQLSQVVARDPNNFQAHLALGMCLDAMRLPTQAIDQYKAAIKLAPDDPKPLAALIRALAAAGQTQSLPGLMDMSVTRFPHDPLLLFLAGVDALQSNQIARAQTFLQNAYKISRTENRTIPGLKACYAETLLYMGSGKAKSKNPAESRYYFNLAASLAAQELREQRDRYYRSYKFGPQGAENRKKMEEAFERDPRVSKANMVLGIACIKMHPPHYSEAADPLLKAARQMPTRTELNFEAAEAAVWVGRYSEAIDPAICCLAFSTNRFGRDERVMDLLVDCFKHSSKPEAKAQLLAMQKRLINASGYVRNALGEALEEAGWHEEALAEFQAASLASPEFGEAVFNLAKEHELYLHDYTGALLLYRKAGQMGLPMGMSASDRVLRLEGRLALGQKQDIAWHLKDLLSGRNPGAH